MYDVHTAFVVKSVLSVCLRFSSVLLSAVAAISERQTRHMHTYLHFSHAYIQRYVPMYAQMYVYSSRWSRADVVCFWFSFCFLFFGSVASRKINERHFYAFSICLYRWVCVRACLCMYVYARALVWCVCVCILVFLFIYCVSVLLMARQHRRSSDLTTYVCIYVCMYVCIFNCLCVRACVYRCLHCCIYFIAFYLRCFR